MEQKDGNKITIGVQLIRAKDLKTFWSEEFADRLENVLYIQESICRKIHEKLNLNIDHKDSLFANAGKTNDYLA